MAYLLMVPNQNLNQVWGSLLNGDQQGSTSVGAASGVTPVNGVASNDGVMPVQPVGGSASSSASTSTASGFQFPPNFSGFGAGA